VRDAAGAGLGVYPVGPLFDRAGPAPPPDRAGLVLGYAALDAGSIDRGMDLLAELLRARRS